MSKFLTGLLAGAALAPCAAMAQQAASPLPPIEVIANTPTAPEGARPAPFSERAEPSKSVVSGKHLLELLAGTPDTARLLTDAPGVSVYQAGGVSSLPVVHGFNDDRNAILVGGIPITSACANHMNPALSYIDPATVGQIEVLTGNIPVSKGGDSIGGTIIATPRPPVFAPAAQPQAAIAPAPAPIFTRSLSAFYRSNNKNTSLSGTANAATEHFSVNYNGAWSKGSDYRSGGGALVRSTNFDSQNHSATIAYRNEDQLVALRAGFQDIPYQGFVNQRMDMMGNTGQNFDLSYKGGFGWGKLEADAFYQHTQHYMNFLADKNNGVNATPTSGMPMYASGSDFGYSLKGELFETQIDTIRLGNEFHGERLNDWWPPVGTKMGMMCCETFENINNGHRDRLGTYVEWERKWTPQWSTLFGLRNDVVWMNTGDVQGYNMMMYGVDAVSFNARSHARTDVNVDATALMRFAPDADSLLEAGYTRKKRSPNLYERYTWSKNAMASEMVNWFGDANGYVGNIDLNPEVAHTLSASAVWRDGAQDNWEAKLTPYFSYVQDYIDVDKIGVLGSGASQVNLLQFANHDAQLYGFDLSGQVRLLQSADYGSLTLSGVAGYVHGRRIDNGSSLYHMMPLNGKAALEHKIALFGGELTSAVELQAVAAKTDVEAARLEPTTPAYALMNLRSAFEIKNLRFDLGVENLFDNLYYPPLAGVDYADFKAGANSVLHTPVAGMGRTIYSGMTIKF